MTPPTPAATSWCWLDGTIGPTAHAAIGVTDHGLTVGDGVFETMKVVGSTPFALTRHLRRLRRSAAALDLDVPLDDDGLRRACAEVLAAAAEADAPAGRLRLTVTGGPGPPGSDRAEGARTLLLVTTPAIPWEAATAVATVAFTRNPTSALAGVKSTSYAENVVALASAHRLGADEAILANTVGALCEGTGTNVFLVRDGRLVTPSLATGCLAGITRELVLELVDCDRVDDLALADLAAAPEAFLTSSTRDVHPIHAVDGTALAAVPGPRTAEAIDAFAALQARTFDP